jgi:hypothetical protein
MAWQPDDVLATPELANRLIGLTHNLIWPDDDQHIVQAVNDGL